MKRNDDNHRNPEKGRSSENEKFEKGERGIPLSKRESEHGYYNEKGRDSGRQNDDNTDYTGPRHKGNTNETE